MQFVARTTGTAVENYFPGRLPGSKISTNMYWYCPHGAEFKCLTDSYGCSKGSTVIYTLAITKHTYANACTVIK